MSPSSSSLPSLHSLAALAPPSTSPTPAEEQAHHLTLLAQQRALALARQERCLARFEAAQVRLAKDVEGELRRRVEVEVAAEEAVAAGGRGRGGAAAARKALGEARQASETAQEGFVERYRAALADFEGSWEAAEALYRRWDVVLPSVSSPSSAAGPPRLLSWLDSAGPDAPQTVKAFLARVLAEDPYVLGSGLAMLPDFSSLLAPSPSPSFSPASSSTPFGALVHFLFTARGPAAVLELGKGLFETALRELVGRERGEGAETPRSETDDGDDGGIGLGIRMEGVGGGGRRRSARARELEEVLVGVLEGLDELGLEVEADETSPWIPTSPALGALAFTSPSMEDLLVHFLSSAAAVPLPPVGTTTSIFTPPLSPPPTPLLPASPTSTSWSPSSFLTTGLSTLTSAPAVAVRTVHSVASAFPFGLPTPPLSSPSEDTTPTTSPRLPSSPESPNKPLPRLPRFRPPSPPPTKSPFELLLARTAADLLALLTPSAAPTPGGSSLVEVLLRQLFSASFPPGVEETQKLFAVAIGRWFAFTRLGAFLRFPAVPLHPHPQPPSPASVSASSSRPFFAGVAVSTAQELELLVPLHREVYVAVTEAIRAVRRGEKGSEGGEGGEGAEERELRRAARAFVEGWAGPLPILKPGVKGGEQGGEQGDPRRLALSPSGLAGLFTAVQDVLFPSFGFGGDETSLRGKVERVVLVATAGQGEREEELAVVYVAGEGVTLSLASPLPPDPPLTPPPAAPTLPGLSSADISLLRRALHTLVSHAHLLLSSSSSTDFSAALPDFLHAASLALTNGEYAQQLLFSRAASILVSHPELDLGPLVEHLAAPLHAVSSARTARSAQLLALAQTQLDALSASRSALLSSARAALTRLDLLRRRAHTLAVLASPLGRQLRERLRAVQHGGRTEEEREAAREEVRSWREELGVVSFFTLTSEGEEGEEDEQQAQWDEALMLVETAAALAAEPAALGLTGLYAREAALLLAADEVGSEVEERYGLASTLLGAPGALLGSLPLPPIPTLPRRPSGGGAEAPAAAKSAGLVFDPELGAVSPAFSSPASSTASTAAAAAADDYLLRLSVSLAGSLFSRLSSYALLPALPADSTVSTFALLLSPSSPLPRPPALQPRGPKPPEFVGTLLRRFVEHPGLAVKLEALVELEKVLVLLGSSTAHKEEKTDAERQSRRASLGATSTTSCGQQHHLLLPPPSSSPDHPFRTLQLPPTLGHRRPRSRLGSGGSLSLQRLFSHTSSAGDSASQAGTGSNPSSPLRATFGESLFPPPPASNTAAAGMGMGGTWRRQHRRGLSVPSSSTASVSAASASASGSPPPRSPLSAVSFAAQQDSPASPPEGQEEGDGEGEGMSTDALLPLLENAVLHFLPSLPSFPSTAPGLLGTLHTLAALAPSLLFAPSLSLSSSSASQQAKAFSDLAVACLAIRADVGEEVVEEGWRALGAEEGERARQLSEIATRESAPGARELALAVAASQQQHHPPPEGDKGGGGDPF